MQIATLSKVTFNTSLGLNGIQRCNVLPGLEVGRYRGDGQLFPTRAWIHQITPAIEFETLDVATALALGTYAFAYQGLALSAAFNCYLTQKTQDGGLAATGDKVAMANGLILPIRLSVRHNQPAALTCRVIGRSADGTTAPMSVTADQNVPAGEQITAGHTVGKLSLNGSAYTMVEAMDLDFNIEHELLGGDGQVYPTRLHILGASPKFTFELADADMLAAVTLLGTKQAATDSLFWLRKFDPNGTRVADGLAEHIKFSLADGIWYPEQVENQQGGHASVRLVCEPVWNGTDAIIVASAAAIT